MDECLVQLRLIGEEATAFKRLCALEVRRPSQEARFLIVRELEKRGLTPTAPDLAEPRRDTASGNLDGAHSGETSLTASPGG
jgi:hypothetical protein